MVRFSSPGSSSTKISFSTLNIDSTGAKNIDADTMEFYVHQNRYSNSSVSKYTLTVYNGSSYGLHKIHYYEDYSDDN